MKEVIRRVLPCGVETDCQALFCSGGGAGGGIPVLRAAARLELGIRGYTRNLEDGRVEVYATGSPRAMAELEGLLAKGPMRSSVRGVEAVEAALVEYKSFRIER